MRSPSCKESLLASACLALLAGGCRPARQQQQARRCPTQPDFHWLPSSSQQLRIPSDSQGSTSTLGLLACCCVYTACHGGFCPVGGRPPVSNNSVVTTFLFFSSLEWLCQVFSAAGRQQVMVVRRPSGLSSAQLHVCLPPRPTHRDTQPITCQSQNNSQHKNL